jgi:hypothetical protein
MSVVRRHHNGNFTVIPNAIFEDERLSVEAKGVLGYLLSRPHNWMFRLIHIGSTLKIGRDKTERIFQELIATRYVLRGKQKRIEGNRWGPAELVVFDQPENAKVGEFEPVIDPAAPQRDTAPAPCPEKPSTAEPSTANQGIYQVLKDNKTDSTKAAADAGAREASKSLITPEAFDLCSDLLRLQHIEQDDPRCIGMAYAVQAWLTKGWDADVIRSTVEIVMSRGIAAPGGLRYFERAIAEAHAERDRPLPVVSPNAEIASAHNRGSSKHANHRNGGGFALNAIEFARRAANPPDRPDQA